MNYLILGMVWAFAGIAIAQDMTPEMADAMPQITDELWKMLLSRISGSMGVDNFVATYLIVMTGLRVLAEGGGYLANKTESKFDNKMVQWLAKGLNTVSWLAGLLGIGTPKNTRKPQFPSKKVDG